MKKIVLILMLALAGPAWAAEHLFVLRQTGEATCALWLLPGTSTALGASWGTRNACGIDWQRGAGVPDHLFYSACNDTTCACGTVVASAYEFVEGAWYELATGSVGCPTIVRAEAGEGDVNRLEYECWTTDVAPTEAPTWGRVKGAYR